MTVAEIIENKWFQIDYQPSTGTDHEKSVKLDDFSVAFDGMVVRTLLTLQYYFRIHVKKGSGIHRIGFVKLKIGKNHGYGKSQVPEFHQCFSTDSNVQ